MLIAFAGLPATGKSAIARELSRQMGATYLRIDSIEYAIRRARYATEDLYDLGYRIAYALAEENLRIGCKVVADSVNPLGVTREAWLEVARRAEVVPIEVEIVCSDREEHQRRLETRVTDFPDAKPLSWQEVISRQYEPWNREHLILDTAVLSIEESVGRIREVCD